MNRYYYIISSLFLLLFSCSLPADRSEPPVIDPEKMTTNFRLIKGIVPLLQSGDMIFRNGNDEVSSAARQFNRKDTSFSHCGLVFIENDTPFVYHALGGQYNPSQELMRQPLDSFCNPAENNAVAIYRYPLNPAQQEKLRQKVHAYYRSGLKFDLFFNFLSDDKMYCAEFVFKSLNNSVDNVLTSYVRTDTLPFGVTTDDLFLHPDSRLIKKEKFIY